MDPNCLVYKKYGQMQKSLKDKNICVAYDNGYATSTVIEIPRSLGQVLKIRK